MGSGFDRGKNCARIGSADKEAKRERYMKTNVLNLGRRATDRTPVIRDNMAEGGQIKHGQGALYKEAKKRAGREPEAGASGKRWAGRSTEVGKGGQEVGKQTGFSHFATGFSHLFPDDSMQVVDFPHLACVRLFREGEDSPQRRRDAETSGAWNRHGEREMECRSFGVLGAKAAGKRQSRRAGGRRSGETPSILVAITGTSRSLKFT